MKANKNPLDNAEPIWLSKALYSLSTKFVLSAKSWRDILDSGTDAYLDPAFLSAFILLWQEKKVKQNSHGDWVIYFSQKLHIKRNLDLHLKNGKPEIGFQV